MIVTVLLCAAAFLAATTQAATGFGFALLFAPVLTLALPPAIAVQVTIIVSLVISLAVLPRIGRELRWGLIGRFIGGGVFGLPIGIYGIAQADRAEVQIAVGILVLLFTAGLLAVERGATQAALRERLEPVPMTAGPTTAVSTTNWFEIVVGAVAGAMTAGLAMPGPALMIYLLYARIDKLVLRSTLIAVFIFFYGAALALHALSLGIDPAVWSPAALYAAVAVAGAVVGDRAAPLLNVQMVRRIALGVLALIGLWTLAAGLGFSRTFS
jgi:uncharacterized membrane protein YfcA